jgi:hypothetical protein
MRNGTTVANREGKVAIRPTRPSPYFSQSAGGERSPTSHFSITFSQKTFRRKGRGRHHHHHQTTRRTSPAAERKRRRPATNPSPSPPPPIMAMAASSRVLWASRAAAYLRISTFPRAFSTGTHLSCLPRRRHPVSVPRCGSWDHGCVVSGRHDPNASPFHSKARFGERFLVFVSFFFLRPV